MLLLSNKCIYFTELIYHINKSFTYNYRNWGSQNWFFTLGEVHKYWMWPFEGFYQRIICHSINFKIISLKFEKKYIEEVNNDGFFDKKITFVSSKIATKRKKRSSKGVFEKHSIAPHLASK